MSFSNLGLSPKVLSAVEAAGFATPTPIQHKAIPAAVAGRDVLGIAQTGIGRTKEAVLPVPVWAMPRTSRPATAAGMALS